MPICMPEIVEIINELELKHERELTDVVKGFSRLQAIATLADLESISADYSDEEDYPTVSLNFNNGFSVVDYMYDSLDWRISKYRQHLDSGHEFSVEEVASKLKAIVTMYATEESLKKHIQRQQYESLRKEFENDT